jgi:basic membrane lipoprotein Med (substrate-binding protein (PBP1-ABC) superfamily)
MKKLNKLLILGVLSTIALFYSCNKKGDLVFIIEGNVSDKSFNQNLQSGVVKLYKVPAATTQEILIAEQNIVNGAYSFTFDRDMSEKYVLRFSKDNYFEEDFEVLFSQLEVGKPYALNFTVEAVAMMNWIIIDQAPTNPNASVSIQKLNGRTTGAGTCSNQQYEYYGGLNPDTLRCAVGGNEYIRFYVIKLPTYTLDSVYCPAFEESFYSVDF